MSKKYWPEPTPDKPNMHSSDIGWPHAIAVFFVIGLVVTAILLVLTYYA
jgi:hypothetical protein